MTSDIPASAFYVLVGIATLSLFFNLKRFFAASTKTAVPADGAAGTASDGGATTSSAGTTSTESVPKLRGVHLKMVLVVRSDLNMGKGKMCAQCCHAAVGVVSDILTAGIDRDRAYLARWEQHGAMKIALKCTSEEELVELERRAGTMKLPHCLIRDAGHTQVAPNTRTVLAIGPAPDADINEITGQLKLL